VCVCVCVFVCVCVYLYFTITPLLLSTVRQLIVPFVVFELKAVLKIQF